MRAAAGDFVDDEDMRPAPEVERFAGGGGGGGERRMALGGGDVFLEPARAGAQKGVDFFARHAHGGREQGAAVGLDAQVDVLDALARDFDGDAGDGELHGAASLLLDEIGVFFIVRESGGAGKARTRIFSADVEYRC